jgi:signal transduction histidine kinase/CheY-like chemotaxis protein
VAISGLVGSRQREEAMRATLKSLANSGISRKIIILLMVSGFLPLFILATIFFVFSYKGEKQFVIDIQKEMCNRVAVSISAHLETTFGQIQLFANSLNLEGYRAKEISAAAYRLLDQVIEFDQITVVDPEGHEISKVSRYYTYRPFELENIAHQKAFQMARQGRSHIGRVQMSALGRFPQVPISVPIIDARDRITGVLIVNVNVLKIWDYISRYSVGEHRHAYIVDVDGFLIASQDRSSVLRKQDLRHIQGVSHLLDRSSGVWEYNGLTGERVIGAGSLIPLSGWGVIVEMPVGDAHQRITALTVFFGTVFVFTLLLAAALGLRFSFRAIIEPISLLQKEAEAITRGEFDSQIDLKSDDELGKLAATFNTMVGNLKDTTVSRDILLQEIEEHKKTEAEKTQLENQIHQTQKLESIGRLAGGVAHDLNNMLSPILGYGELLMEDLKDDEEKQESLRQIVKAGHRARDLVRHLLAFSRRQTLAYTTLNLNNTVESFEKLLRRTIREDIALILRPSPDIQPIKGDVGQIEQVIMNLCVNAQDAMPDGGKLTIETAMVDLDADYLADHPGTQEGRYVMLAISDNGMGMDADTQSHIFEPFFSTKGEQGTGLGLATVYGIVKQHGGNVWVYSEPGQGTTFKVYLPVARGSPDEKIALERPRRDLKGSETILLSEDNAQVRQLSTDILKRQGYHLLVAENGTQALNIVKSHKGQLDLLLTDVVMPDINGKELFARLAGQFPGLRVLYMSGYTNNVIAHKGVLDEGIHFIQKPFTVFGLASKVREVLELDRLIKG